MAISKDKLLIVPAGLEERARAKQQLTRVVVTTDGKEFRSEPSVKDKRHQDCDIIEQAIEHQCNLNVGRSGPLIIVRRL